MIYLIGFIAYLIIFWILFYIIEVKQVNILPVLIIGVVWDVAFNFIVATVLFLKFPDVMNNPRQWTFSERLKAYYLLQTCRGKIARFICDTFLDPFLPNHCK